MHGKISSLLKLLSRLPGVHYRSTRKIVFALLKNKPLLEELIQGLVSCRDGVFACKRCYMYTESASQECAICSNQSRNQKYLCVVSDMTNLLAIEKTNAFHGIYYVLNGMISRVDGIGPEDLNIEYLVERVKNEGITDVLVGLSPTTEGQATALLLKDVLQDLTTVQMLGVGVALGSDLEYLDANTIAWSIKNKTS